MYVYLEVNIAIYNVQTYIIMYKKCKKNVAVNVLTCPHIVLCTYLICCCDKVTHPVSIDMSVSGVCIERMGSRVAS